MRKEILFLLLDLKNNMREKIRFRDLSFPLKSSVIVILFYGALWIVDYLLWLLSPAI
ncbi:hypothetical protein LCGC14_0476550 [marine sediment metagenome]|uniref:Preprotein translocase subunit SecE n=1 Tax=marine sediment metagenome TaxID=412755 RepID=A0A0F9STJ5_9ZZZZ